MNYSNGYLVSVVVDGRILETRQDGIATIPFGKDYSIRLTNKNNRKAVAIVYIDGKNVSGGGFVIDNLATVDIERPFDKNVTFRFASINSNAAKDHGKSGPDVDGSKGLIKVEWRPEKEIYPYGTGYYGALATSHSTYNLNPPSSLHSSTRRINTTNTGVSSYDMLKTLSDGFVKCSAEKTSGGMGLSDINLEKVSSGVTVEGGHSNQSFRNISFNIDYSSPITVTQIKLMGYNPEDGVPRTGVNHCPACNTKTMKQTDRFCRHCGEKF